MIHSVVFDLDDTLCDYRSAKQRAFNAIRELLALHSIDGDRFFDRYQLLEPSLFRSFTGGLITRQQYRVRRFADALAEIAGAPTGLGARLNEIYMSVANEQVRLFDDVPDTVGELRRRRLVCAILSNGPSDGQRLKIAHCGLLNLIEHVFISEELGVAKPAPESFLGVADALGQNPANMMMVGDSWEDDVRGAQAVGMTGVLVDRFATHHQVDAPRVRCLREILALLDSSSPGGCRDGR